MSSAELFHLFLLFFQLIERKADGARRLKRSLKMMLLFYCRKRRFQICPWIWIQKARGKRVMWKRGNERDGQSQTEERDLEWEKE